MKLWELTQEYQKLLTMLEETSPGDDPFGDPGEDDEGTKKAIEDTLAGLQGEITEKVDGCVAVMRTLEHEAESIRKEEMRMAVRRRALENRAKRLKDYVKDSMVATNTTVVESSLFRVKLADAPWKLLIADENQIPEGYYLMRRELQQSAVKLALKDGLEVPGAHLVREKMLRIT